MNNDGFRALARIFEKLDWKFRYLKRKKGKAIWAQPAA